MSSTLYDIVLPLALRHPLTYRIPEALKDRIAPGQRVTVPLGKKIVVGCALKKSAERTDLKLRDINSILDDVPILRPVDLKLLEWASAYYLTPIGEVLRHLLPPPILNPKSKETKARKSHSISPGLLDTKRPPLNAEQRRAFEMFVQSSQNGTDPLLIDGITGSGKTEVYLAAIQEVVQKGGQALVLVPEIGLTPQILGRFHALQVPISAYHSGLTEAQRYEVWKKARAGEVHVVIATRSGVFLSFQNLKTIVIDEEHDTSYKQEDRFCYHARDLALWRGHAEKIPIILGSATPSLESLERIQKGKMIHARLTARPLGAQLPRIEIIDRRMDSKQGPSIFSSKLLDAIEENLKRHEQTLLFLNRRGYAPSVLCPECGFLVECDQCDVALTLHRGKGDSASGGSPLLICHYCEKTKPYQPLCSRCGHGVMTLKGFGTEKVAQEIQHFFPSARMDRLDRDTVTHKGWMEILEKMKRREIDILIGTQMITKGHDYPYLTLVGILDADVALSIPDFRSTERTFQLLNQVAGRAGRAERPGRVLIQTYQPFHPSLTATLKNDAKSFYQQERGHRSEANYPPFVRLIEIRFSSQKPERVQKVAIQLVHKLNRLLSSQETLLGPAPCPITRVRGMTRWHLVLKTPRYARLQPLLASLLDEFVENDLPSNVRMLVNVDPLEMN